MSLVIVVTATVLGTGNNPPKPGTAPSLASLAVQIAIGARLVAIAIRQRRRIGRPNPPKWQQHVEAHTDQVITAGSLILGFWLIANSIYPIVT